MGRMVISNNKYWHDVLKNDYLGLLGLDDYCSVSDPILGTFFRKKNVKNNYYEKMDDGFIAVNGTLIYKDLLNAGLQLLYRDFNDNDEVTLKERIKYIRQNAYGNYVVVICVKGVIYIFVDESSSYPIYYGIIEEQFVISNTFCNVQSVLKQKIHLNKLLEYGMCAFNIGTQSPFENVSRLQEDQCIVIENGTLRIQNAEINHYGKGLNDEQTYELLKKELLHISSVRSKYVKKALLFTTGGIDSRLGLALYERNRNNNSLGVWNGKDIITNGTDKDNSICLDLAKRLQKEYRLIDVSTDFDQCILSLDENEIKKYGEYCSIYGHNKKWLDMLASADYNGFDWVEFGATNAILKTVSYLAENWHSKFLSTDMVRDVFMRSGIYNRVFQSDSFIEDIGKSIDDDFITANEDSIEEWDKVFNYNNHLHAGETFGVYMNLYVYNFSAFAEKRVFDLVEELSYNARAQNRIPIKLTSELYPQLLNVPYFSHHHTMIYNVQKNMVEELKSYKLIYGLRQLLKGTLLYEPLNRIGHLIKKNNNHRNNANNDILALCLKIIGNSKIMNNDSIRLKYPKDDTGFDLPGLVRLTSCIRIAEILSVTNSSVGDE